MTSPFEFSALNMLVLAAGGLILYAMVPEIQKYRKQPAHAAGADMRVPAAHGCGYGVELVHGLMTGDPHLAVVSAIGAVLAWVQVGQIWHARRLVRVAGARSDEGDDGRE